MRCEICNFTYRTHFKVTGEDTAVPPVPYEKTVCLSCLPNAIREPGFLAAEEIPMVTAGGNWRT